VHLVLHKQSKVLELELDNGQAYRLPFELMRVYSPSAEVRGHGAGQAVLQVGKRHVDIVTLEPIGQYAVKATFSDGHDTGLFTWKYLVWLGVNQEQLWADYEARLSAAGASRDAVLLNAADTQFVEYKPGGCKNA
jgi:DUF971 family protein